MTTLDANKVTFHAALIFELLSLMREAGEWVPGLCLRRSQANDGTYNLIRPDGKIVGRIVNTQPEVKEKTMELPLYQSHKKVRAAKIGSINRKIPYGTDNPLHPATKATHFVFGLLGTMREHTAEELENKTFPEVGMYYIEYVDGKTPPYFSFSPAKEFEEEYSLIGDHPFKIGDQVVFSAASGNEPGEPRTISGWTCHPEEGNAGVFYELEGLPGSLFQSYSLEYAPIEDCPHPTTAALAGWPRNEGEERGYLSKQFGEDIQPMEPNPGQTQ